MPNVETTCTTHHICECQQERLRQLQKHLEDLLSKAGHLANCRFVGCTCGRATKFADAILDANKYLRDTKCP